MIYGCFTDRNADPDWPARQLFFGAVLLRRREAALLFLNESSVSSQWSSLGMLATNLQCNSEMEFPDFLSKNLVCCHLREFAWGIPNNTLLFAGFPDLFSLVCCHLPDFTWKFQNNTLLLAGCFFFNMFIYKTVSIAHQMHFVYALSCSVYGNSLKCINSHCSSKLRTLLIIASCHPWSN